MSGSAALWGAVFGNPRPVEIEIGPGRGDVLLAFAAARPDINFFAIEHAAGLAEALAAEAAARGLPNVRVVAGDARCVLGLVPPESVAALHIYFPDPWPKTRHRHRRLFAHPGMGEAIARLLAPSGRVHVASDLAWLHRDMCDQLAKAGLREVEASLPARPVSKFERKYAGEGTWAASFVKPA